MEQKLDAEHHDEYRVSKKNPEMRFVNVTDKKLTIARLAIIYSVKIILNNGLKLLGVKSLEVMR